MQGQWYLNWVSLLLILMIILKSLFYFDLICRRCRCVCTVEGERVSEREKRKLENLKIKRNSICRRLRIAKEKKKNRVLSSNSFNINVPQCNLIFILKQKPKLHWYWINLLHDIFLTFGYVPTQFSALIFRELDIAKNVIFRPLFLWKHVLMSEEITFFLLIIREEIGQKSHQRIKHYKQNWLIALYEWKSTTLGHFLITLKVFQLFEKEMNFTFSDLTGTSTSAGLNDCSIFRKLWWTKLNFC